MKPIVTLLICSLILLCSTPLLAQQSDAELEVQYLISAIEQSEATFIRNGTTHSASEAAAHLRMKYERGRRYIHSAEDFINLIASRSSMSKKPYWIQEPGQKKIESGVWLQQKLSQYRHRQSPGVSPEPLPHAIPG